jgi:hypothetical protein
MRSVRVLFLRAAPDDHWINRLVSTLDPPFCHVEIEFDLCGRAAPDAFPAELCTLASSIYANETVFLKQRTFANPNYAIVTLNVGDAAFDRMLQYARRASEQEVAFSGAAMYLSFLPHCCNTLQAGRTFCSAYVTSVLQAGGVQEVRHLTPCRVRPSTLFHVLSGAQQQSFSTVPYKMGLLRL